MENLGTSLWITLIGMGIVFIAIILLWGLMSFLVSVFKEKENKDEKIPTNEESDIKEKVAAVAVAIALNAASQSQYQGEHPTPISGVSSWQSSFRQTPS
jgi:Na+-transporting methylmalonyl-CoA/oxaloacetate decarboxylase gamma subunit